MKLQIPVDLLMPKFQLNKIIPLVLIFLIILFSIVLAADQRFHLVHADKHSGKIIDGQKIRFLEGNVEGYQDTLKMYCDRAVFYEEQNKIHFLGNVLINDGHHKLWADKIIYFTQTRLADCQGNVRISGKKDSLFAQNFIYSFKEKNARGKTDVYLWDKSNSATITGDKARYLSDTRYSEITGNATLIKKEKNESDTLFIDADKMEYFGQEPKKAFANKNVKIKKGNIRATCDSAVYLLSEEKVYLRKTPFAWQDDNNMSGVIMDFYMDSLEVKKIFIEGSARIKTLADSLENKYNELSGKTIEVNLMDKKPENIIARINATSIYLIEDEEEKQGTNAASSDSIMVYFYEGEMDSISIIGGSEGTMYPADHKGEISFEHDK